MKQYFAWKENNNTKSVVTNRSRCLSRQCYHMFTNVAASFAALLSIYVASTAVLAQDIRSVRNVLTDEVVVTAQRREQKLQDVGIAVTAVTGEQMRALGYTNAQDVTAMAPGVSTVQPNGEANYSIAIRGVANSDFTTNVESPIAVYVDDIYISQMSGAGFMLFDMERAEILRGPQGTLFGRNATGGLVQYITVKPSLDNFNGYGSVTLGSFNQTKFETAVGIPLTDKLAVRVSGVSNKRDGYVKNRLTPGQKLNNGNEYAYRVQILYEDTDWNLLLNIREGKQDIRTGFFENVSTVNTGRFTRGEPNPYLNNADGSSGYVDRDGDVYAGDYDFTGHNDLTTRGYSATVNWSGSNFDLISITDYSTTERDYIEDSDASPEDYFKFFLTTDAEQFSQEFRVSGSTDDTQWVAGLYYLNLNISDSNGGIAPGFLSDYYKALCTNFTFDPANDPSTRACDANILGGYLAGLTLADFDVGAPAGVVTQNHGIYNPYDTDTESWSLFGQVERRLSNMFSVTIGGRWIKENKDHFYRDLEVSYPATAISGGDPRAVTIDELARYNGSRDDDEWAARLQLDYRPTDDMLFYASYNRGVKSGGFNAPLLPTTDANFDGDRSDTSVTNAFMSYDPEHLDAYEIGAKQTFMDGMLTVNSSVFFYDYQDYQAFALIGLDSFTMNAEAESKGFEVEVIASPSEGLDLLFGAGFVDTEVTKVPGVTENRPGFDFLGQASRLGNSVKPVQTPEWNINALARYEMPVKVLRGNIAYQLSAEYRDEHYFNLTNSDLLKEDGYTLWNGAITYYPENTDRWNIQFKGQNLTDEEYVVQGFDLSGTITNGTGFWGMTEHYFGKPRTFSVSLNFKF
jgi:iron complex outermembrane receptor protein